MKALLIGGTGPTGPYVVAGLQERSYEVTLLHRGLREIAENEGVQHIHADPFDKDSVTDALADQHFDLVIAAYGRLRLLADIARGVTERFVAVTSGAVYQGYSEYVQPEAAWRHLVPLPMREEAGHGQGAIKLRRAVAAGERTVFDNQANDSYSATILRYPYVYGPRQLVPREWRVIRRLLDGRRSIIVVDGGLTISSQGFAANLAHAVLLAVDRPVISSGQVYNCGDERLVTVREWIERIAQAMEIEIEIVSVPTWMVSDHHALLWKADSNHRFFDLSKITRDLGYRDIVPIDSAVSQTVDWYLSHPLDQASEARLPDPFDYEGEDSIIDNYAKLRDRYSDQVSHQDRPYSYPYGV